MVILLHYSLNYEFNAVYLFWFLEAGCPIFFVASGFGIMCLINGKFEGRIDRSNISGFYLSRYKALAPAWYTAILIVFAANTILIQATGTTLPFGTNRSLLSIICNFLFLNGLLPFCNNDVMLGGWYIGTTAILYALTPAIHRMISRAKNRYVFAAVSSVLGIVIWLIWYFAFRDSFNDPNFGYYCFLVHYPEYILGILLYYDFKQKRLSDTKIRRCLPLSIISLIIAIVLFFDLPMFWHSIPSAWMTGFAAYFALYYMLSNEKDKKPGRIASMLINTGKNSYCIFLLHGFFAFPFVSLSLSLLGKAGVPSIVSFFLLIPATLLLSYLAGYVFRALIIKITGFIFRNK